MDMDHLETLAVLDDVILNWVALTAVEKVFLISTAVVSFLQHVLQHLKKQSQHIKHLMEWQVFTL